MHAGRGALALFQRLGRAAGKSLLPWSNNHQLQATGASVWKTCGGLYTECSHRMGTRIMTTAVTTPMLQMDPVPEAMKSSMLVSSYQEELRRRQRVATSYFSFPVHNHMGEERGSIELATAVFQMPLRVDLLQRVVLWQRAKARGIARQVKTRAMVSGGGKKPWKQKGTGRARVGSIRMSEGRLVVWDSDEVPEHKTAYTSVITGPEVSKNLALGSRNLHYVDVLPCVGSNVKSILKRQQLVLTKDAVEYLHKFLLRL